MDSASTYIYHHCGLPPHSASCSSVSAGFICIYLHLHMQLCTTTTDHHHTVQVARVQVQYLRQWLDEKAPTAQVAEGDTTTCASGLSALVVEWKSTTSASCNWWQPPPVQVEYLHQLKEGKHHKHKVQRSGCKVQRSGHNVQRSGPASALVGTGCSNNMQLQPPPPPTMQIWPTQHDAAITATCVRVRLVGWMVGPHASCSDCCIVLCWSYLHGRWWWWL